MQPHASPRISYHLANLAVGGDGHTARGGNSQSYDDWPSGSAFSAALIQPHSGFPTVPQPNATLKNPHHQSSH